MRWVLLLLVSLSPALAHGGGWQLAPNGYYYNGDGYYYTRQYTQPYWYCGVYYAGTYNYVKAYQIPEAVSPKQVSYSRDWRTKVLELAQAEKEDRLFMQALRELNLGQGVAASSNTTATIRGTQLYQAGYQPHAAQGSTLLSLKDYAPQIGQFDLQAAFNDLTRVTEQQTKLLDNANYAMSGHIGQFGAYQSEIAKIREAGKVAVALAQTTHPPQSLKTNFEAQIGAGANNRASSASAVPPPPPQPDELPEPNGEALPRIQLQKLINKTCLKCHNAEKAQGDLDLSAFDAWSDQQFAEIGPKMAARIGSRDPEFQMPPADSGIVLTPLELKLFYNVLPLE